MLVVGDDGGCDGQVRQHDLLVGGWEQLEQHVVWGEGLGLLEQHLAVVGN